jgi:hypothetical protein
MPELQSIKALNLEVSLMRGLIEFSHEIGLAQELDEVKARASIDGQMALEALRRCREPSPKRLGLFHKLRTSARTCPFASLALGCLLDANHGPPRPLRLRLSTIQYANAVKLGRGRIVARQRHGVDRYGMALREAAVEALRLLAMQALDSSDRCSAAEYLAMADEIIPSGRNRNEEFWNLL